jgi:hypothetical protein
MDAGDGAPRNGRGFFAAHPNDDDNTGQGCSADGAERLSQVVGDAKLRSPDVRIRTGVSEYERSTLTFSQLVV